MVDHDAVRRRHGFHPLRVIRVVAETPDARSFVLAPSDGDRSLFDYRAGQYCTFRVNIDGDEHLRSYSMSSSPETDEHLAVTVKRVPGGLVSNWLNDHVGPGDVLEATAPAGVFVVDDAAARPVVAFCGGSGITPVMSITQSVLSRDDGALRLLFANRDRPSAIFHDRLLDLQQRHPSRLEVVHHFDEHSGLLDADDVRAFLGDLLDVDVLVCGPTPFMDLVEQTLRDAGVDPARISTERFVNAGQAESTAPAAEAVVDSAAGGDVPETVTVILKGRRHEIAYQPGDTLLETARRGGLQAPFSCEAGNCATCMALVHEGGATMRVNDALTPDEVAEGWVLTCQGLPHGPSVTVEYESF